MNALQKLWRGQYGLPITYWVFGVLGTLVLRAVTWLLPPTIANAIAAVVVICIYLIVVQVGVWRAASAYKGPVVWAWLAKVIAALSVVMAVALLYGVLKGQIASAPTNTVQNPPQAPASASAPSKQTFSYEEANGQPRKKQEGSEIEELLKTAPPYQPKN